MRRSDPLSALYFSTDIEWPERVSALKVRRQLATKPGRTLVKQAVAAALELLEVPNRCTSLLL